MSLDLWTKDVEVQSQVLPPNSKLSNSEQIISELLTVNNIVHYIADILRTDSLSSN